MKSSGTVALRTILVALRKSSMGGDVRAIELLLDRAYLKQKKSTNVELDFMKLTDMQLTQVINRLIRHH